MHQYVVLFCCILFFSLSVQVSNVLAAEQPPNLAEIQKFAELGIDEAQTVLATMYAYGHGAPQDYSKAAYWYQKAVEQGNIEAHFFLSEMYASGLGIPKNEGLAEHLLQKAVQEVKQSAQKGEAYAQCVLGGMYIAGKGVTRDKNWGCILLHKSAEQGFKRGIDLYKEFCTK